MTTGTMTAALILWHTALLNSASSSAESRLLSMDNCICWIEVITPTLKHISSFCCYCDSRRAQRKRTFPIFSAAADPRMKKLALFFAKLVEKLRQHCERVNSARWPRSVCSRRSDGALQAFITPCWLATHRTVNPPAPRPAAPCSAPQTTFCYTCIAHASLGLDAVDKTGLIGGILDTVLTTEKRAKVLYIPCASMSRTAVCLSVGRV
eukprot:6202613-Pleurochrysis_carterae.AAC.5